MPDGKRNVKDISFAFLFCKKGGLFRFSLDFFCKILSKLGDAEQDLNRKTERVR